MNHGENALLNTFSISLEPRRQGLSNRACFGGTTCRTIGGASGVLDGIQPGAHKMVCRNMHEIEA